MARLLSGAFASFVTGLLGASAVTFGRNVLLSREAAGAIASGSEHGSRILRHELAHVDQYAREGSLPFLRRYIGAYIEGRRRGLSHFEAYEAIPYEREAVRAESG